VPDALKQLDQLQSPTVGTWRPALGLGAPVAEGQLLGRLVRVGRPLEVRVPAGVHGVLLDVRLEGSWVACGDSLARWGQGSALVSAGAEEAAVDASAVAGARAVRADTDGTVYLRPEPGKPPFAAEGEAVGAHQTLALVEVMKTFTPVRAPVAGVIARVDVVEGQSVREGQALVWIRSS
jgi:acetyl/propionyl-CoA carboxylase alpha subunit